MMSELRYAAAALSGIEVKAVPIHGDGNVSNLLISDAGEVRLIDWDRATTADPLEDLGSLLVEAFDREPEARGALRSVDCAHSHLVRLTCLTYLPVKSGFRFSRNARVPSLMSSVAATMPKSAASS